MGWLDRLLAWLQSLFAPQPPPGPTGPAPTGPTGPLPGPTAPSGVSGSATGPAPPPPIPVVTAATPFRGISTLPVERFRAITFTYPIGAEAAQIHQAVRGQPLPLAQSWMESRYGQDPSALATHNPLGLLWYPGMVPVMPVDDSNAHGVPLIVFPTWAAAFAEWARRMDDPTYKGGVYMPADMPLGRMIRTYVAGPGPGYANNETAESVAHYLNETIARLNRYFGVTAPTGPTGGTGATGPSPLGSPYTVAGLSRTILLPFPLHVSLVPRTQTNQRPGIAMVADRYIQHETGNPNPGANATMHKNYLHNGADGQQLGYHFTVDDEVAYQMIPADEVTWHGGDGGGPCNFKGLSCELCIEHPIGSPQDKKAQENAVILAAELMNAMGITLIKPHVQCIGTDHHCPDRILNQPGGFDRFAGRVGAARIARKR